MSSHPTPAQPDAVMESFTPHPHSHPHLSGTLVTVANVGDSRAVLGYVKEVYPTETHALESTRPAPIPLPSAPESAATSPEDTRSIDPNCPLPRPLQEKPVWTESKVQDPEDENFVPDHPDVCVTATSPAPAPSPNKPIQKREFSKAVCIQLSVDHKPNIDEERNRILKTGQLHRSRNAYLVHCDTYNITSHCSCEEPSYAPTALLISTSQMSMWCNVVLLSDTGHVYLSLALSLLTVTIPSSTFTSTTIQIS